MVAGNDGCRFLRGLNLTGFGFGLSKKWKKNLTGFGFGLSKKWKKHLRLATESLRLRLVSCQT